MANIFLPLASPCLQVFLRVIVTEQLKSLFMTSVPRSVCIGRAPLTAGFQTAIVVLGEKAVFHRLAQREAKHGSLCICWP